MRKTFWGCEMMFWPWEMNMMAMVKRRAMRVMGEMRGRKVFSYQWGDLRCRRMYRERRPARKGIPR